ncbi:MAG: beta-1,3-glucanase family protein [Longimicrobiaceae bacterium]
MATADFQVQITNRSGLPDSSVFVTAFGTGYLPSPPPDWPSNQGPPYTSPNQSFIAFADGQGSWATPSATPPMTLSQGYSYPLDSFPADGDGYLLALPAGTGRIYLSLGAQLCLAVTAATGVGGVTLVGIAAPAPGNPNDPNYQVIYDFLQFNWNPAYRFPPVGPPAAAAAAISLTAVDAFGIPMTLELDGQTAGIGRTLAEVQSTLLGGNPGAAPPQPGLDDPRFAATWGQLPVAASDGTVVRVLSPATAAAAFQEAGYLQGYIDQVWSAYAAPNTLRIWVDIPGQPITSGTYTGSVNADNDFVFKPPNPQAPPVSLPCPDTQTVFTCSGQLSGVSAWIPQNGEPQGIIVSALATAMNLGILPLPQPTVLTNNFSTLSLPTYYDGPPGAAPAYNLYAALLHSGTPKHHPDELYAFAFDNVAGDSGQMYTRDPATTARVTIHGLGGVTPPPLTGSGSYKVTLVAGAGGSGAVTLTPAGTSSPVTYTFANLPGNDQQPSVTITGAPATFTVTYDSGSGEQDYLVNLFTQSTCPPGQVSFQEGGTLLAWPA